MIVYLCVIQVLEPENFQVLFYKESNCLGNPNVLNFETYIGLNNEHIQHTFDILQIMLSALH